jgi:hypothetical protein
MIISIRHISLLIVLLASLFPRAVAQSTKELSLNYPYEMRKLIRDTTCTKIFADLRKGLFTWLENTDGQCMPLKPDGSRRFDHIYNGTY